MASFSCGMQPCGSAFLTGGCGPALRKRGCGADRTSKPRAGRRAATAPITRAILVPQPPEPPKKPTWQEQLANVTQNGPSGLGRKNRGPRRRIKPHIKKTSSENASPPPNSVDAQLLKWREQSSPAATSTRQSQQRRGDDDDTDDGDELDGGETIDGVRGGGTGDRAGAHYKYGFTQRPQQVQETLSYSFLGQSTVRYPFSVADPSDPASLGVYRDSKPDKLAIEMCVKKLADSARVDPALLGDATSYDSLARVAMTLYESREPEELRQKMAGAMRRHLAVSMPPGSSLAMQSLMSKSAMNEANATVVSEGTEWLFGPTTRETLAGPDGVQVTAVNVKKCRFLEATGGCAGACTSMCKLPVQDVVPTEFGVPVYMQPNYRDCSCKMFFGMEPLPEKLDPALKYAAAERSEKQKQQQQRVTSRGSAGGSSERETVNESESELESQGEGKAEGEGEGEGDKATANDTILYEFE